LALVRYVSISLVLGLEVSIGFVDSCFPQVSSVLGFLLSGGVCQPAVSGGWDRAEEEEEL
jgi:hypothetical protein